MRLTRTDILPLLVILGGGALGVVTSAALVLSARTDYVSAPLRPVVAPESAPLRPVVAPESAPVGPVWSPDGTSLVWSADGTWGKLECAAIDGSAVRLPMSEVEPFSVSISPDGRWLTRSSNENGRIEVHVRPRGREQLCVGPDGKARIFRRVPGVRVRPNPITFVDGVRVNDPFFLERLNPADIQNIEVMKGNAAVALYGEDAVLGVIRIRLKQARRRR